jgi:hypothetical protein
MSGADISLQAPLPTGRTSHFGRSGHPAFEAADHWPDLAWAPSPAAAVRKWDRRQDHATACCPGPARAEPADREAAPTVAASDGLDLGARDRSSLWLMRRHPLPAQSFGSARMDAAELFNAITLPWN